MQEFVVLLNLILSIVWGCATAVMAACCLCSTLAWFKDRKERQG